MRCLPRLCATLVAAAAVTAMTRTGAAQSPPLGPALTRQVNLEGRVLWMDATANLRRLSTREGMAAVFEKCRRANINTVVVDVRPLSGHVLWPSAVAPRLTEWRGFTYPAGYDLLLAAMIEGRRTGIRVFANLNCFSKGHKLLRSGPLYEKPEAQAVVYDVRRTVTAPDGSSRRLVVGENRVPGKDELASRDETAPDAYRLGADAAAVVVEGGSVTAIADGSLAEGGPIQAPRGGHVLIGRGESAAWLRDHLRVGDSPSYVAEPVLQGILESPSEAVGAFVNPADPAEQEYLRRLVEELAESYALDGIVLDRMRNASLRTDFSPLSRRLFEEWRNKPVARFPEDIYEYDPVPGNRVRRGEAFLDWIEWRSRTITNFLDLVGRAARARRPSIQLAAYVGSWYSSYYGVGVNWAAPGFFAGYDWMRPSFAATGYADKLDWITTGCYYPVVLREDARDAGADEELTVEAAAELSVKAVQDATFVYAGLQLLDYRDRPDEFRRALRAAVRGSQGVMLFDLVYLEEYNWWNLLGEEFAQPRRAPHEVPGLRDAIRKAAVVPPG